MISAKKRHDCVLPDMSIKTVQQFKEQRRIPWWPWSEKISVPTGKYKLYTNAIGYWTCPVCKSEHEWHPSIFARASDRYTRAGYWECTKRYVKKVSANSAEALDKMDPWQ